jgi:hypothetical protein
VPLRIEVLAVAQWVDRLWIEFSAVDGWALALRASDPVQIKVI